MIRHTSTDDSDDKLSKSKTQANEKKDDKTDNPFDESSDDEPLNAGKDTANVKAASSSHQYGNGSDSGRVDLAEPGGHQLVGANVALGPQNATSDKSAADFLRFTYYQQFFDVDTQQVLRRLFWSAIPNLREESYIEVHIQPKPDLYGPFWIAATLACTTAMASTIVNIYYSSGKKYLQRYDYNKASITATVVYLYTFIVPSVVWSVLRYKGENQRFSLLDLICLYGYSLAVYIPVSLLWIMQPFWLQWVLVICAAITSGCVLMLSFRKVLDEIERKVALVLIVIIICLHMFVAFGFAAYFLQPNYSISH